MEISLFVNAYEITIKNCLSSPPKSNACVYTCEHAHTRTHSLTRVYVNVQQVGPALCSTMGTSIKFQLFLLMCPGLLQASKAQRNLGFMYN